LGEKATFNALFGDHLLIRTNKI